MNYAIKYGLRPADRIIEPIFATGLSKHHAIYLGMDQQGIEWIAENYKLKGVRLLKASDYFTKGKLFKVKKFDGNYSARKNAVQRALVLVGRPYDLIDFNCEHYAEYVQTGNTESKQVKTALGVLACIVLIGLLATDK